jgi:glycine/D-amino acid oxidase-like deaminating enzyme
LADTLGADRIDYRRLTCATISVNPNNNERLRPKGKKLEGIEWAQGNSAMGFRSLGGEETIAQVHPKKLCHALWEETQRLLVADDSKLVQGKVVSAEYNDERVLVGAKLDDGTILKGDALLYACGPWMANLITGVKYHSVVLPTDRVLSQCVFFSGCGDPEVYVRPDQTVYLTGFPDDAVRVTEQPGQEEVRPEAIQRIETAVQQASSNSESIVSSSSSSSPMRLEQACYLPSTPDGLPFMGALPDQPQCFVAAGHSCWGILMGPATGEAMANVIAKGTSPTVDLQKFRPDRFGKPLEMVP